MSDMEELQHMLRQQGSSTAFPSTATFRTAKDADILLPPERRAKMPLTKSKYLIREAPELVLWERETRLFLRQLSPNHEHRVAAVMIYEWATGKSVKELMAEGGSTAPLRRINQVLRHYFGKGYKTTILGKAIPNAYKVPAGFYITRTRPLTLTLYVEYAEGTLKEEAIQGVKRS